MANVDIMHQIQTTKAREEIEASNPALDAEGCKIMLAKRMDLDEPPTTKAVDPMR